jgi:hypothetical protein
MQSAVSMLGLLLFLKGKSKYWLSRKTKIPWKRLNEIIDGSPVKRKEIKLISIVLGIDLEVFLDEVERRKQVTLNRKNFKR